MSFYSLSDHNYDVFWQPLQLSQWLASALQTVQHTGFRFNKFWQRVLPLDLAPQKSLLPKISRPSSQTLTFIVALFHWDPLFDLFCLSRSSIHISSAKWIWVTQQLRTITLARFSVTACISVSLQDEIIRISSRVTIVFQTLLHYLSPILMLQEHLHERILTECLHTAATVWWHCHVSSLLSAQQNIRCLNETRSVSDCHCILIKKHHVLTRNMAFRFIL